MINENSHVRFVGFSEFSFDIELYANIDTTQWEVFLEIAEGINLETMAALESAGVKLAMERHFEV